MGYKTGLHLGEYTFDSVYLMMKLALSGQCGPKVANLAGWRTGAKIKFPVEQGVEL